VDEQNNQFPAQTRDALEKCLAQIRLVRATELAQSERFIEAQAVLMPNAEYPDNPRELDLLARIAARQGSFEDARRLWNKALYYEPENENYKQCLACLTPARRIPRLIERSLDTLLPILVWGTVGLSIGAIVYCFWPRK
jgi:tetratricopeptide (TPR) repeat protein